MSKRSWGRFLVLVVVVSLVGLAGATAARAACLDLDGDGYDTCDPGDPGDTDGRPADCDDTDANTFPGAAPNDDPNACMTDADRDDYGDRMPAGGVEPGTDCDDTDETSYPGAVEVCDGNDNDCDGTIPPDEIDDDGDGYVECTPWNDTQGDNPEIAGGGDEDDSDPNTHPGGEELCDGNDNDGDGVVPDDEIDNDGDGYVECSPWNDTQGDNPEIHGGGDCDDDDHTSYPGAPEVCDGNDNDCDGTIPPDEIDNDGDGYVECTPWEGNDPSIVGGGDCDDSDASTYPGAAPNDDPNACMTDADRDDYGDRMPAGGVEPGTDCDDADATSYPGASEACDGNDNDCDETIPPDEIDDDGDGYVECSGWNDTQGDNSEILGGDDCDDSDAMVNPGAEENCSNGVDDDCDGSIDGDDSDCASNCPDADGDGYDTCAPGDPGDTDGRAADCDDGDPASYPGAPEVCDGNDNDCENGIPEDEIDNDGDGYVECHGWSDSQGDDPEILGGDDCADDNPNAYLGAAPNDSERACMEDADDDDWGDASPPPGVSRGRDCDDEDPRSHPEAIEICDGNDNDCDQVIPGDEIDDDHDGYVECTGWKDWQGDDPDVLGGDDCRDDNPDAYPGAAPKDSETACMEDADGDDYGNKTPPTFVTVGTDCDDTDGDVNPGEEEAWCNGKDDDCDSGTVDAPDADDDGFDVCDPSDPGDGDGKGRDCDDDDQAVHPGAAETACDGIDQDCDGLADDHPDEDGDGYDACAPSDPGDGDGKDADCDDTRGDVHPGAEEVCDSVDNDCDDLVDEDELGEDTDGDGVHNACDNCRDVYNADQADADTDGIGNACDNCLRVPNPDQANRDGDSHGDACDNCPETYSENFDDSDGDGLGDVCDNCVDRRNESQHDLDGDGEGDECDLDDGVIFFEKVKKVRVRWQSDPSYGWYNLYRGSLEVLVGGGSWTQEPGSNPYADHFCDLADTRFDDTLEPAVGEAFYWLVTGESASGEEPLGDGAGVDRENDHPCP